MRPSRLMVAAVLTLLRPAAGLGVRSCPRPATTHLSRRAFSSARNAGSPCVVASAAKDTENVVVDDGEPIAWKAAMTLPNNDDNERLLRIRHSTAHVMAMAVQKLYKGTKVSIGPWIEKGFYYDFDPPEPFKDTDLRRIKKEMDKIIKLKLPFTEEVVTREEAERRIKEQDEPYKLEILNRIKSDHITIWHTSKNQDGWWDLCAGPHVETTGDLPSNAIALESIAGAYFFGDENGPMLQRIYGTAWENADQLAEHQRLQAEAKRRDHRIIGKQLNLFSIQQAAGGGLVFWHPKGATMRNLMEEYWKVAHVKGGYELLNTPHMASIDLWKTSGHFDFYKDDMFDQMEVSAEGWQSSTPHHAHSHTLTPSPPSQFPSLLCSGRGRRVSDQADELPLPRPRLQGLAKIVPRPAHPVGGARHRLPLRALRLAQRPLPRARLHPGRRAHLLPARSAH